MRHRIADTLASLCLRHSKLIAIMAFVIAAAAIAAAGRIRLEQDGRPRPVEGHIVVVNIPSGQEVRGYQPLITSIADGYRQSPRVAEVADASVSTDRATVTVHVKPKSSWRRLRFARQLVNEGNVIEARALAQFQKTMPGGTPLPTIEHRGAFRTAVADASLLRRDIAMKTLAAVVSVLLILLIGFGRATAMFYGAAPLLLALVTTVGVAGLAYGRVSPLTSTFVALVAGIGAGFAAIFYGSYALERGRGAAVAEGLIATIRATAPRIAISGLVAAIGYYVLLRFGPRPELATLTAVGILLVALNTLLLLPAVIALFERRERMRWRTLRANATRRRVVLTAVVAVIVAYATLALSHYPRVPSIGYASAFGAALICIAALMGKKTNDRTNTDDPVRAQ